MCNLTSPLRNLPSSWNCSNHAGVISVCEWEGVQCLNNSVISIDLLNRNVSGSIATSIGSLSSLKTLQLSGNFLSGSIPDSLCYLRQLQAVYLCESTSSNKGCPDLTYVPLCLWDAQAGLLTHYIPGSIVFPYLTTSIAIGSIPSLEALVLCQVAAASVPSSRGTYCTSTPTSKLPKTAVCSGNSNNSLFTWINFVLPIGNLDGTVIACDSYGHISSWSESGQALGGSLSTALGQLVYLTQVELLNNALTGDFKRHSLK